MHHNAVLFEGVGGFDEAGLRELVRGSLRGVNSFTVEWIVRSLPFRPPFRIVHRASTDRAHRTQSNTDVLLHPSFTLLTSTSISSLLGPLTHLHDQTAFCTALEGVYVPPEGGEIKRGGAWTPVAVSGNASGSATPSGTGTGMGTGAGGMWRANGGARGWGTNLFDALGSVESEGKGKAKSIPAPVVAPTTSTIDAVSTTLRARAEEVTKEEVVEKEVDIPDDWEQVDAVASPAEIVDTPST